MTGKAKTKANKKSNPYEISSAEIKEFDFEQEHLTCKTCNNILKRSDFPKKELISLIKKLSKQEGESDASLPKLECHKCIGQLKIREKPHLVCCVCKFAKSLDKFLEDQHAKGKEACCMRCMKYAQIKEVETEDNQNTNPEKHNIPSPNNSTCINQQIDLIQDSNKLSSIQNRLGIVLNQNSDFEESDINPSKSESYEILNPLNVVAANNQHDPMHNSLIFNLSQNKIKNFLPKNNSKYDFLPQVQKQDQVQPQSSSVANIPRFDTNIYSLSQLLGRKNPSISNYSCNQFNMPKDYETRNSSDMDTEEDLFPFVNNTLYRDHIAYNQQKPQYSQYTYENVEFYVNQIVNSVQGNFNNRQNRTNLETSQNYSTNYMEDINVCNEIQPNIADNINSTDTEKRLNTNIDSNLSTQPGFTRNNDSIQVQRDINISTTENDYQMEQTSQENRTSTPTLNYVPTTAQANDSMLNSSLDTSLPNGSLPIITTGRYRNRSFNLSEVFGKSFNPLPIPLPSNTNKFSNSSHRENPYKSNSQAM